MISTVSYKYIALLLSWSNFRFQALTVTFIAMGTTWHIYTLQWQYQLNYISNAVRHFGCCCCLLTQAHLSLTQRRETAREENDGIVSHCVLLYHFLFLIVAQKAVDMHLGFRVIIKNKCATNINIRHLLACAIAVFQIPWHGLMQKATTFLFPFSNINFFFTNFSWLDINCELKTKIWILNITMNGRS